MSAFTGTWRLVRLNLRRDRIKLPVWMIAVVGLLATAVPTLQETYGSTHATIVDYAHTMGASFVGRFMGGPIDGAHFGSVVMMEYFLFVAVIIIFMSTLAIVRHTRQNEELGRSELIGSGIVGRYAPLTAALLVVVAANMILVGLIAASLIWHDLPVAGSLAMAAAYGGVGIVFAAIAAVAAQIISTARGTNAVIGAIIGASVLLRGVGDSLGKLSPDGMTVHSAWPSWLSPIGWGQQMHQFSGPKWWITGLFVAAFIVLTGFAYWLANHRDHGLGMIPVRSGRADAKAGLLSPLGLAWRLQKTVLLGWALAVASIGVVFGVMAVEIQGFFQSNEQLKAVFQAMSGSDGNFTDIFFVAIMMYCALMIAGYGLQAILHLQSEELAGHLEPVLSTATSRLKWALSHVAVVGFGVVLLGAIAGFTTGLSYVLSAGVHWSELGRFTIAGLVQIPAALVLVGFAIMVFGIKSHLSSTLAWAVFIICLALSMLGELLKLPNWFIKLSPFASTPAAPADSIGITPLITMTAIAIGLAIVGLITFRRRDISSD